MRIALHAGMVTLLIVTLAILWISAVWLLYTLLGPIVLVAAPMVGIIYVGTYRYLKDNDDGY